MPRLIAILVMLVPLVSGGQTARPNPGVSFDTLSRKAAEARDANRLDEALALYQKALRLRPTWDEGWWNVGSIAYDQDKYAECVPAFRRLTALKPDRAPAWTMCGLCEYRMHEYAAALKSLHQAEQLGFDESPELSRAARLHLALLLTKTGSFEKAIVLLTELTRIDRKSNEILTAAGIAALRKPWLPAEVPEASRDVVIKLGDAMAAAMELDPKAAIEKFEIAARDYPQEPNVHFRFGAYLMQQAPERGLEEIKKALTLDPTHIPALVGMTMIYIKLGDPEAARAYGEKAVKAGPEEFSAHVALGRALMATEDIAGSARELEAAVKLAPASPEARFSLASAYSRLGRKADAEREHAEFKRLKSLQKVLDSSQP